MKLSTMTTTNTIIDTKLQNRNIQRLSDIPKYHARGEWQCLICHHTWSATANNIINRKTGCPACKKTKHLQHSKSRLLTTETFIAKARITHGSKYSYTLSNYERSSKPITIECSIHGKFFQTPNIHLRGSGCPDCGHIIMQQHNSRIKLTTLEFIDKSNQLHHNKYLYSETQYINNRTNVNIICPFHGLFSQSPTKHLSGTGCPSCGTKKLLGRYNRKFFLNKPEIIHVAAFLYVIIMIDTNDTKFIKVGITRSDRATSRLSSYGKHKESVVSLLKMTLCEAYQLEQTILNTQHAYQYKPQLSFSGHTECLFYNETTLNTTLSIINNSITSLTTEICD